MLAYRADQTGERAADLLEQVQEKHTVIGTEMGPKVKQLEELLEGGPLSRANHTCKFYLALHGSIVETMSSR